MGNKKYRTYINQSGKYSTNVGVYTVVQESKHFSGIYLNGELKTSKTSWRSAIRIAKLLNEAFHEGMHINDEY